VQQLRAKCELLEEQLKDVHEDAKQDVV